MKKIIGLIVFAGLAMGACTKAKTSNISVDNSAQLVNSVNTNTNSATLSNINGNISNQNSLTNSNSQFNTDIYKQVEAQQLETSDPRKAANKNNETNKQSPKTAPAGRKTW